MTRRTLHLMDRFDRGDFRHGIEAYEHRGCRCDICTAAHVRVEQLAARLDDELHSMRADPGRYPAGIVAPLDAIRAADLDGDIADVRRETRRG